MRNIIAACMALVWFGIVGCLAAAAPMMSWPTIIIDTVAVIVNGLWLVSFTSNR